MDARADRVAAMANAAFYDSRSASAYLDGAPHIKHASLRSLYGRLVVEIFDLARQASGARPVVLDIGAGEGSVTLPFLELGADVVAVDLSSAQLAELRRKAATHAAALEVRCQDAAAALAALTAERRSFDVVVCNSFLHHVPDYLGLIRGVVGLLRPGGQFFSFQDPMRYDTLGRFTRLFSAAAYFSWRVRRGDVFGGLRRRWRRSHGIYTDTPEDNAEFHVVRGGIDHAAIADLFDELGFECDIIRYFSTQSRLFQPAGSLLKLVNSFGVVARRHPTGVRTGNR